MRFSDIKILKVNLFLLKIKDWFSLKIYGKKVSHRSYGIMSRVQDGKTYYIITKILWTEEMERK